MGLFKSLAFALNANNFFMKTIFFSLQKPCDSDVTAISIESYGLNIALLSVSLVTHLYYNPCLRPPSMKQ